MVATAGIGLGHLGQVAQGVAGVLLPLPGRVGHGHHVALVDVGGRARVLGECPQRSSHAGESSPCARRSLKTIAPLVTVPGCAPVVPVVHTDLCPRAFRNDTGATGSLTLGEMRLSRFSPFHAVPFILPVGVRTPFAPVFPTANPRTDPCSSLGHGSRLNSTSRIVQARLDKSTDQADRKPQQNNCNDQP